MNLFFEESGDFKVGTVLSQAGEAYQVEMPSGKRTKVKVKDVLVQYEKPGAQELLDAARAIAADADFEFLWEVAGQEEFGFAELGAEYFGHAPLPSEAAGLILALHGAPIYFYKKGRGRYKAAPEASLRAAQAGIEKKKQQAVIQDAYVAQLKENQLPEALAPLVHQLLFKPDKNTIEYKALDAACNELHTTAPRLMLATGGIKSPKDLHMARFLFDNFPRGAGFPAVPVPATPGGLGRLRRMAEIFGAQLGKAEFVLARHFPQEFEIDVGGDRLGRVHQLLRRRLLELQQHVLDLDLGTFPARHFDLIGFARLRQNGADFEVAGFFEK